MSCEFVFYESLKKIVACIEYGDRRFLSEFDLTSLRFYALKHIDENPGISLTTLSALMLNDKSSTTRLIRSLQEEGLVQRYRSESDYRTYCLYLSELGKQRYERASAAYDIYTRDRFSNVKIDIEGLINGLVVIIDSLEHEVKPTA
jgi:DNA-binding MarR family transcriptional regulator